MHHLTLIVGWGGLILLWCGGCKTVPSPCWSGPVVSLPRWGLSGLQTLLHETCAGRTGLLPTARSL